MSKGSKPRPYSVANDEYSNRWDAIFQRTTEEIPTEDHIIPLQGSTVSGLHIDTNLQYLLAVDNMSKGNRFLGQ